MLDKFIARLNQRPILWTVSAGILTYFCAFTLSIVSFWYQGFFELGFLVGGTAVMGYHWLMSRYIRGSKASQFIQLMLGLILVSAVIGLIGASTHLKAYEFINEWLY
ncbi:hypothetical protein N8Z80_02465 [Litorivicinus sp.]|nr:hypothetical protein [Litorivicinus sp.]